MDASTNIKPATPEIVWNILRELAEKQTEFAERQEKRDAELAERQEKRDAEFAKRQAESNAEFTKINAELAKRNAELAVRQAETDRQIKETGEQIKETGEQIKETGKNLDKVWEQINKTSKLVGAMANNHGSFAEEYFFNSFEKGKRDFFGEKFDDIRKNVIDLKTNDEYDIVMLNGQSVGIVEVKYKAHKNDIQEVLGKAKTFRANFADYKSHKIYLGLATMAFYPILEQACKDNGIAIIKQVGDTIIIHDEHLKAF